LDNGEKKTSLEKKLKIKGQNLVEERNWMAEIPRAPLRRWAHLEN
jgi:hypothetical protein